MGMGLLHPENRQFVAETDFLLRSADYIQLGKLWSSGGLPGTWQLVLIDPPGLDSLKSPVSTRSGKKCQVIPIFGNKFVILPALSGRLLQAQLSFDTGATSRLAKVVLEPDSKPKTGRDQLAALVPVVKQLIRNNKINWDIAPYLIENLDKALDDFDDVLQARTRMRTLRSYRHLISSRKEAPPLTETEVETEKNEILKEKGKDYYQRFPRMHKMNFCSLAKIVLLHREKLSEKRAILRFVEFMHQELRCFDTFASVLAIKSFSPGLQTDFLGRLRHPPKHIVEALNNMAWDLTHYRLLLNDVAVNTARNQGQAFYLPHFVTLDLKFNALLETLPLIGCAVDFAAQNYIPFFSVNVMETFIKKIGDEQLKSIYERRATIQLDPETVDRHLTELKARFISELERP